MADQRKGKRYAHYNPAYEAYIRRLLERQQGVSAPEDLEEQAKAKLEFDLYYIKHMSAWLDIVILMKTLHTIVVGSGVR